MSMQEKCTTFLITAVSGALLASCAANRSTVAKDAVLRPMLIANAESLSAADVYAQRFASSNTQIEHNGKHKFVRCQPTCPGATPKTAVSTLTATVVRRALANAQAKKVPAIGAPSTAAVEQTPSASENTAVAAEHRAHTVANDSEQ